LKFFLEYELFDAIIIQSFYIYLGVFSYFSFFTVLLFIFSVPQGCCSSSFFLFSKSVIILLLIGFCSGDMFVFFFIVIVMLYFIFFLPFIFLY